MHLKILSTKWWPLHWGISEQRQRKGQLRMFLCHTMYHAIVDHYNRTHTSCHLGSVLSSEQPTILQNYGYGKYDLCVQLGLHRYNFSYVVTITQYNNTSRPRHNGCHFPDDIFKLIFLYQNFPISNKNPQGPINNIPAMVQIMAWHWIGNKPLPEPMTVKWWYLVLRRLKSRASGLFAHPFVQVQIKENIKVPYHWPLWGESTGHRWLPSQRASYVENVSIWWHHVFQCFFSGASIWCATEIWMKTNWNLHWNWKY